MKGHLTTRYSKEFKDIIIKQMMPQPINQLTSLQRKLEFQNIPFTHGTWLLNKLVLRRQPVNYHRSVWSSEDKFSIVLETATMN